MQDLYAGFAERYDKAHGLFEQNDPEMTEFFRKLFAAGRVQRVLDCACGTGRHLLMLRDLGCDASGSDVSPSMLEQARKNLDGFGLSIPLQLADFRDLARYFSEPFDAVLCLAAIGYMPDEAQFFKAFESMCSVLREDGILVLTSIPTDRQWKEKPRYSLIADTPECSRLFVMDYYEHTVRYNILDILRGPGGTELKTWSAELTVLLRDDQEKILTAAGFRWVEFFGGYDFGPYDKAASNQVITVAHK